MEIKQRAYYEMEYHEANELIQKEFNRPDYEIIAEEEWCNDTEHTAPIKVEWLSKHDRQDIEHFIAKDPPPYRGWRCSWVSLFCWLAEKGKIPEGDYLIRVGW